MTSIQESGFSLVCSSLCAGWGVVSGAGFAAAGAHPSCFTPHVSRALQGIPVLLQRELLCVVCSKSCLQRSSEQPTGRGNTFSSKFAAARDGLSASCKKLILQKAAEILWRQTTKEIPAVGSMGCCWKTWLLLSRRLSL